MEFSSGTWSEMQLFEDPYVGIGTMYFLIILIIGIFFVISAILTMKGKVIPHIGLIWLILGAFLILSPLLIRTSLQMVDLNEIGLEQIFGMPYCSILLFMPMVGILVTVPEILNKTGDRKNG